MSKFVYTSRVICRNFIRDILAGLINITGGRVTSYEEAINQAIKEAYEELEKKHGHISNVHLMTSELMKGAAEIVVYGEVD